MSLSVLPCNSITFLIQAPTCSLVMLLYSLLYWTRRSMRFFPRSFLCGSYSSYSYQNASFWASDTWTYSLTAGSYRFLKNIVRNFPGPITLEISFIPKNGRKETQITTSAPNQAGLIWCVIPLNASAKSSVLINAFI
jgi:hypothetical protein